MTVPPARRFAVRARHAIAFVVIVWGVAATFVAFEIVALSGMDIVLSYPRIFGDIALSRSVTQSVACAPRPGETSGMPSAAGGRRDAGAGAWLLGVSLGRDAVVRQLAGVSPASVAQMAAGRSDLASRLGIPPPAVFGPQQMATANTEFIAFVEQDAGHTAHRLAVSSSPRACELFKLGAFWGYSEVVARRCRASGRSSRSRSDITRCGPGCRRRFGAPCFNAAPRATGQIRSPRKRAR